MKYAILSVFAILAFTSSCKKAAKKEDPQPTPIVKYDSAATVDISIYPNKLLRVDVHYTDKNTTPYQNDIIEVYINDTLTANTIVPVQPASTLYTYMTTEKYSGTKYSVKLIRQVSAGSKQIIASKEGI